MLNFNWKFLTPLALVVLMVTAILDKVLANSSTFIYTSVMFGANLVIIWVTLLILRSRARIERQRVAEAQSVATPDGTVTTSIQRPVSSSS
jgi:threonine/homoserine/homoserine lactone efflux protein